MQIGFELYQYRFLQSTQQAFNPRVNKYERLSNFTPLRHELK
jgi:hypothetical protein